MPTYLLHGFRWPRPLIRIHIILQNLDDCAAEWLMAPMTSTTMLANFTELFPESMPYLPNLRFIEQYDPNDESAAAASQPFAYVADIIEEVRLGVDVDDVRGRGIGGDQWGALMEIRDRLAPDEKVGWWVVVCGDTERWAPRDDDEDAAYEADTLEQNRSYGATGTGDYGRDVEGRGYSDGSNATGSSRTRKAYGAGGAASQSDVLMGEQQQQQPSRGDSASPETPKKGLGRLLNSLSKRKSSRNIREGSKAESRAQTQSPSLPPFPKSPQVQTTRTR